MKNEKRVIGVEKGPIDFTIDLFTHQNKKKKMCQKLSYCTLKRKKKTKLEVAVFYLNFVLCMDCPFLCSGQIQPNQPTNQALQTTLLIKGSSLVLLCQHK